MQRAAAPQHNVLEAESGGKQKRARFAGIIAQTEQAEGALAARRHLIVARRRLSTEVVSVINGLFTEFYATIVAAICGVILRGSSVVTLLDSDLTLEQLPLFAVVQFVPEFGEPLISDLTGTLVQTAEFLFMDAMMQVNPLAGGCCFFLAAQLYFQNVILQMLSRGCNTVLPNKGRQCQSCFTL